MQRNVTRVATVLFGHAWRNEEVVPLCQAYLQFNTSALRSLAHESSSRPSAWQRRAQPTGGVPYLTTDNFGLPTVLHRSSAPDATDVRNPSGTPYDVTERLPRRIRSGRSPRKAAEERALHEDGAAATQDVLAERSAYGPSQASASASGTFAAEAAMRHSRRPQGLTSHHDVHMQAYLESSSRAAPHHATQAAAAVAARSSTSSPASPRRPSRSAASAASQPQPLGPASHDRMLTFRLLKANSLRELDQLLSVHPAPPNMIHMAAAARQGVLLGSLPQPGETQELLDRHLLRVAAAEGAAAAVAAAEGRGTGGSLSGEECVNVGGAGADSGGFTIRAVGAEWPSHEDSPARRCGKGENAARRANTAEPDGPAAGSAAAAPPPPPPPLREVGDLLWAYGKLQCKPPRRAWSALLRPVLLDPAAWRQQLRDPAAAAVASSAVDPLELEEEDNKGGQPQPPSQRRQWRRSGAAAAADEGEGKRSLEEVAVGRELSKAAVALARMKEQDTDVWRMLARVTAGAAAYMSPRALASTLWAFGSVRMTQGSLLAASVRAVHHKLRQFNGQDLVCVMWALSRLAPPPDGDGASKAAATATTAAAAARDLLYGDLSDAVRRCLQLRAFKSAELTTLIGVLDELADQHQEHQEHLNPRLLRVLSQAVRKNMSSLPVGALAVAASSFQRLGHHDAALYRTLAAGMALRLRHMEPRHMLRAVAALQAAGLNDPAFFAKVLETAQLRLGSFKRHELLNLVELCSQVVAAGVNVGSQGATTNAPTGAATLQAGSASASTARGTDADAAAAAAVTAVAAARALIRAAVLSAVASAEPPVAAAATAVPDASRHHISAQAWSTARLLGHGEGSADGGGSGSGGSGSRGSGQEQMRLRHWHRLLRVAASVGWRDEELANRAMDLVLQELRRARPAWLNAVRMRAAAAAAKAAETAAEDVAATAAATATCR